MPRHREAKKDAANSEMRRGAVSMQRAVDIRMGEPTRDRDRVSWSEEIAPGTETSKYLKEEKIKK